MDGFADLLTDVFSDSSVPSFSDGDLDFENLNFDEKREEGKAENPTTTDEPRLQEATAESEVLSDEATTDPLHTTANAHQEKTSDESEEENFTGQTPAGDYTSSEEERSSSGEDEEMDEGTSEEPGDLSPGCSRENHLDDKNEDMFFSDRQAMVSEGADDPNVCSKVRDEAESDEEVSYFGGIPEGEDETVMKSADEREREEGLSDSDSEGMKIEKEEENVHQLETKTSKKTKPEEESLEFPSLSLQNLQDLLSEVDGEEYVDKMTDFTEDEHQEAGESFADYPSDFSSGEYTRAEANKEENKLDASPGTEQEACLEGAVTETPWTLIAADTEKNEGFLYSRDLEINADEITSLDKGAGEGDESNSDSDDDEDEEELPRRSSEHSDDVENHKKQEDVQLHDHAEFSSWSSSGDPNRNHKGDLVDFIRSELDALETDNHPSEYLFSTDDSDEAEAPPSGVNPHPAEHVNHYSVVQREEAKTTTSNQGSIDDSFFFNSELDTPEVPEVRQLTDEECDERRNFEQMQKRIEAFKRFYDSDEENGREERQIKVQFCDDPLSRIIHYETDSSDRESFSSSSDRDEEEEEDEDEEEEEEEVVEEKVVQDEDILVKHEEEEKKVMEEEEENEVEEMIGQDEGIVEELEEEEKKVMDEEKVEEDKDDKAKEEGEVEENEEEEEEEEESEETMSSTEIFDDLMDSDDSLQISPECDPSNVQLQQKMSEVRDTHTFQKTHKGLRVLKMMLKLGVMTTIGLLMFWLISDQPDFLTDLFSF